MRATNGVGDSPWSNSAKAAPTAQKPSKPSVPTLTVKHQSLGVSWTAPANNGAAISDYDIQYRACTATGGDTNVLTCAANPTWGSWSSHVHTGAGTTATITGLTNGTAYQVQVQATNSAGDSPWSDSAKATPAPQKPDKPAAPTLTVKHQSLGVSWTAPAANGSAITGYDIRYRACTATDGNSSVLTCATNPTWGTWASHTHSGTGTTASITGLANGTAYQVQVQAANGIGDSPWSDSATAAPAPQKPDKPTAPTLTVDNASLGVSWTAPAANGSTITDYDIEYCNLTDDADSDCADASDWTEWDASTKSTATAATITGLTNTKTYRVRVRAVNSVGGADQGNGPWSDPASAAPAPQKPDKPAAPTLTVDNASLDVSWTAPAANGSAITGYDVQYSACTATDNDTTDLACDGATNTWGTWTAHTHTGTGTTATITGLTNGTAYQVQVQATNGVGDSPWSNSTKATPAAQKPDKPTPPTLTVDNASLSVSWTAPTNNGSGITGYDIQYRACTLAADLSCSNSSTATWESSWTSHTHTGTDTTATITGLTNDTAYQVQVQATNGVGDSPWSNSAKAAPTAQKPSKPSVPTLTVKHQSLGVSWTAPANNGSTITDYDIQYRACTATDGDTNVLTCAANPTWGSWTEWSASDTGTGTTAAITGLTNGTAYQAQVRATNAIGDSPWSDSAKATPAVQPPDTPGAPTLTADNASLDVSWTAPATNGSAITGYNIRYRACTLTTDLTCSDSSTAIWETDWTAGTHTGTGTTATITGLTNGTKYQVQVQADSAAGASGWSLSGSGSPAAQPPDAPGAPSITVANAGVSVSWSAPATNGSAITGYDVQYRACTLATDLTCSDSSTATWETDWTSHGHSGTGTTATITGLTNGTKYQVQVQADSAAGASGWSASADATPSTTPDRPSVSLSGISGSPTSSRLTWTAPNDGGSPITGYVIGYRCAPGNAWKTWTTAANVTSYDSTISECSSKLSSTQKYRFRVRANNANGFGKWSSPFADTSIPSAVGAASIVPLLSGTQMSVSWTAPADGGLEITDYDLRYRIKDTDQGQTGDQPGTWTTLAGSDDPGKATSATITGLTADTAYQLQIRATNAMGTASWSASKNWPQPPTTSSAPTVSAKHQGLLVSWTAFASNGAPVDDHDVQYRACTATDGNTSVHTCATNPTWASTWTNRTGETTADTDTSAKVTGLTNGTAYQVRVRAANFAGEGAWSTESVGTPAIVAPDAPAAPAISVASTTSLSVSWSAPAANGSAITDYDVQYRACTATDGDRNVLSCATNPTWDTDWADRTGETASDTSTNVTLTGLTQATAYQVQVRAANSIGEGAWSPSGTAISAPCPACPTRPR